MTEIEMKAAEIAAATKAAEDAAKEAKAETAALREELAGVKAENDNLDASMKAQAKTIEEMQAKLARAAEKMGEKAQIRAFLESKRDDIARLMSQKDGRMTLEIKTDIGTTSITPQSDSQVWGSVVDPVIAGVPHLPLAFLSAFGVKPITGERIVWREATNTENVGYVAELAQNTNNSSIAFNEKFRQAAKIATFMTFSSEVDQWFPELVNFCTGEGRHIIQKKIDAELYNGNGDTSTYPNHIFGVLGQATAHAAQTTYANANLADLIFDCAAQAKKEGFNANVALLPYALEAQLRSIKTTTGAYLYDAVNHQLGGITIIPTDLLTATVSGNKVNSLIVADSSVVNVYEGDTYELELSRKPEYDAWRADFRKLAQCVIKTPNQKGVIKVANVATDLSAITAA